MKIIRDLSSCPPEYKGATIALGNFDGVHLGHQAILKRCIDIAKKEGSPAAVMTFEPHPREFFSKGGEKLRIYSFRDKVELLRDGDIEALFVARFNPGFALLSAEDFVNILHHRLAARHVVTGYNFAFGNNRQGNTEFLAEAAERLGFDFSACLPVDDADGKPISSSAIRGLLAAGDVKKAAGLLGRPYRITGHVQSGEQRGRTLGFPTANLSLKHLFKPRFGIYAARIAIEDGTWHDGVASLGVKPTFGTHEPLLEAHLFDRNDDLYGQRVRVELVDFIREEKYFNSAEALRSEMTEDCKKAKEMLHAHRR